MKKILTLLSVLLISAVAYGQDQTSDDVYEDGSQYEDDSGEDYDYSGTNYAQPVDHNPVDPEAVSEANGYANENLEVKRFNKDQWKKVVAGENYSEVEPKRKNPNDDSLLDKLKGKERKADDEEEDDSTYSISMPFGSSILTYVFFGIVVLLIAYILFLIIRNSSVKSKFPKKERAGSDATAQIEDIKELEIDRLLREALAAGNYKLAVRIYFLGLLKKLDEGGIISWKKDKTNRDYLYELLQKQYHYEEIRSLTLSYEEVWYGEHTMSTESYQDIIASFKNVDQKLNISTASATGQ